MIVSLECFDDTKVMNADKPLVLFHALINWDFLIVRSCQSELHRA